MARTITDEQIKLSIIINGNSAQKQLLDLEKSTRKLTEEKKGLQIELRRVETALGKDSTEYKKLALQIKQTTTEIDNNKATMKELQNQIGITGLTISQLTQKANLLKLTLKNLVPGSEDYNRYEAELKQVSARLGELSGKAQQAKFSISNIADGFNKYAALGASVIATLTGVVFSVQKMIDINGKLSDAQADVMKTTRMNKEEVDELGKSFGLLETRTSRIDLYKIAEQGGRLGIPKAEIADFVKSMNVAAVSLGDSFEGGVEEVAEKLGKIKFLFKETKDLNIEDAYNSIGSAINDLGADGVASEANIAEFTKRIGSLNDVLKPTVQETLALGAAFEESGIEAETSSRAFNIFMKQASTESAKFAQVMGISKKSVEDMINTNPLDFMLNFAQGLNGMNATEVAKTLDFLGVNADGANKVIGAMGNNFERFHELIDLSNQSFATGSSLADEYKVKNENLAATLEKISKKVSGWFSSEGFINFLGKAVNWFAIFIGATNDADGAISKWKNTIVFAIKAITIMSVALFTNIGWQKLVAYWTTRTAEATLLQIIATKARTFAENIAWIATAAYSAITALLAGNITKATTQYRIMTAVMASTPWGFLLAVISSVAAAYVLFSDSAKEAVTAQSTLAETSRNVKNTVELESGMFVALIGVVNDSTASYEARSAALVKAKEIGGEYTKGLTLQNANEAIGKTMIDNYIKSLERKITLQVLEAKQKSILEEIQKRRDQGLEDEVGIWERIWITAKNGTNTIGALSDLAVKAVENRSNALKELQDQLGFTQAQMKDFLKANPNIIPEINQGGNFNIPGDNADKKEKKDPNSTAEELARLRLENEQKYTDASLKLRRQLEDDKVTAMKDGYLKEMTIENLRYKREIEDLNNQKVRNEEMAKLDEEIAKAKVAGDTKKHDALLLIKKGWSDKNDKIDKLVNQVTEGKFALHKQRIAVVEEKWAKDSFKKKEEQYNREKEVREIAYNQELLLLGNNKDAKAQLKKQFDKAELEAQKEFLTALLKEQQDILAGKNGQVDLSILTPEEKQVFIDAINDTIKKLSELGIKVDEINEKKFTFLQGSGTDIFGQTPDQWQQAFTNLDTTANKIAAVETVLGGLQNAYGIYNQFAEQKQIQEQKSLDKAQKIKRDKLKRQLDSGYISQVQYDKQIKKLDTQKEKDQIEMDYKKAKRDRLSALFSIAMNTGIGVMKAVAESPLTFGLPWSGIIAGMGIIQAALVPPAVKGYEDGLYGEEVTRSQDGKKFRSTGTSPMISGLFSKPRILVGEGPGDMPEMVIDKRAYSQISPATKNALLRELRGIKGFEQGYYDNVTKQVNVPVGASPAVSAPSNDAVLLSVSAVLERAVAILEKVEANGILAIVDDKDYRSLQKLNKAQKEVTNFINKSKA